jgi:uncharacterized protein (TIGR02391 family)
VATVLGLDIDEFLELEPDEIGLRMLPDLLSVDPRQPVGWNNYRIGTYGDLHRQGIEEEGPRSAILARLAAGWQWLRNAGFLGPHPDHSNPGDESPTAEARSADTARLADQHVMAVLREARLDADLRARAIPIFRRGTYSAAVFQAFLELEDRVRVSSRLARLDGVDLMTQAFKPGGPLANGDRIGDQEGAMGLFRGAFGVFRNEGGHQTLAHEDPQQALALVLFVNLLLGLIPTPEG